MKIEISIDENQKEPKVLIVTSEITEDIHQLLKRLTDEYPESLKGYIDQAMEVLPMKDIVRIFSENQRVYAQTHKGKYALHARLYELEESLDGGTFVRISNSEIINSRKIRRLDTSITGTIAVYLENDIKTFASRRYVSKLKKIFGL